MAVDDADRFESEDSGEESEPSASETPDRDDGARVAVGTYTWADYLDEYGTDGDVEALYGRDPRRRTDAPGSSRWEEDGDDERVPLTHDDWAAVAADPGADLGFHPADVEAQIADAGAGAGELSKVFEAYCDPATTPVVKDVYSWEHYKREYYYREDGSRPRDEDGELVRFDESEALGFDPDVTENALARGGARAEELAALVDERTVDVRDDVDEDDFFTDAAGETTTANRYDLEKAVPMAKKTHFEEVERYWVNEPYAFVVVFHSRKENESKYYVVEPYLNPIERDLEEFLTGKLRTAIKYADESVGHAGDDDRRRVIEAQTLGLLERYDLYHAPASGFFHPRDAPEGGADADAADGSTEEAGPDDANDTDGAAAGGAADGGVAAYARRLASTLGEGTDTLRLRVQELLGHDGGSEDGASTRRRGIAARPEPAVLEEDADTLTDYQVEKLLYYLVRDFTGYERIDGIKHDIHVEDVSCDGYESPVFVYHSDYEQIISNVFHGTDELDNFVVKLAQRSGKGISKRQPQVDATLPDGSRAQLTLGREVSDHGTNYTIRQFKDVPFTPIDLINWRTFSLEEMAYLWLAIENNKSLIFAGGTASGKTTSLNAVSLFIPSNSKIVSIEDTREVELPQRNWIASTTRPSFTEDDKGDVDEFDLLEAALRQRPDYIVMGEIRGEEGRTLFQVMSTGHTTLTTFHADSVGEVLKRFTTDPINVSKTMFTALDLVSIQTSTRVGGQKVRRNKSLTEINFYDPENDDINVQDVYQWQAETDEFLEMSSSNTLEEIQFDRGWSHARLRSELFQRQVVLAYLIDRGLNTYAEVAATLQAFINDQETIVTLMANDRLGESLADLREMESVLIDIDPDKEEMVPRPDPVDEVAALAADILARAEDELFAEYRGRPAGEVVDALDATEPAPDPGPLSDDELDRLLDPDGSDRPTLDAGSDETPELDAGSAVGATDDPPALDDGSDDAGNDDAGNDDAGSEGDGVTADSDADFGGLFTAPTDDPAPTDDEGSDGREGDDANAGVDSAGATPAGDETGTDANPGDGDAADDAGATLDVDADDGWGFVSTETLSVSEESDDDDADADAGGADGSE